jgi:hypothetical protein
MIFHPFRARFLGYHGRAQALSGSAEVALELGHLLLCGAPAFDGHRDLEIGVRANDMKSCQKGESMSHFCILRLSYL